MSTRDNWERLVEAVLKRQQLWQLCHAHSRSPSVSSTGSDITSDFSEQILSFSSNRVESISVPSNSPVQVTNPSVSQASNNAFGPITRRLFSAWHWRRKPKIEYLVDIPDMEAEKARKIDRAMILALVAERQMSSPMFKRISHHFAEGSRTLPRPRTLPPTSKHHMSESEGLESHLWAVDGNGPLSGSMTTHSVDKFCPDWNVTNHDSLYTQETAVEMMSHLIPPSDIATLEETNSEVLSYDGYDLLAKQLLTHHGMVLKINYATTRIKELVQQLDEETNQKYQIQITLDSRIAEVDRLREEIASLEVKIAKISQQANGANMRADEATKAKEAMEDILPDYWLDGFGYCKEMVLKIDPTFDVGLLAPNGLELMSGTNMEIEQAETAIAGDAIILA